MHYHHECKVCSRREISCIREIFWSDTAVCADLIVEKGLEDHPITKLIYGRPRGIGTDERIFGCSNIVKSQPSLKAEE
jgi:hypothetical protein